MLSLAKAKDVMLNAKIQATVMQMQSIIIDEENTLNAESPKIGGTFILENNELILAKNANKEGLLNEKTASKFKSQLASCTLTKQPNDLYIISIQLL